MPVLILPGLAWGGAGRLRPVSYPADWAQARRVINADPRPGKALLLPWSAYRRYGWNHGEAVLDPWPRLLDRDVIWNDGVQVGAVQLPPEDPAAVALNGAIRSGRPLTSLLRSADVRYVIVDAGFGPGPAGQAVPVQAARLPDRHVRAGPAGLPGPGVAAWRRQPPAPARPGDGPRPLAAVTARRRPAVTARRDGPGRPGSVPRYRARVRIPAHGADNRLAPRCYFLVLLLQSRGVLALG